MLILKKENNYEPIINDKRLDNVIENNYYKIFIENDEIKLPIQYSPIQLIYREIKEQGMKSPNNLFEKIFNIIDYSQNSYTPDKNKEIWKYIIRENKLLIQSNQLSDIKIESELQQYKEEKIEIQIDSKKEKCLIYKKENAYKSIIKKVDNTIREKGIKLLSDELVKYPKIRGQLDVLIIEKYVYNLSKTRDEYMMILFDCLHDIMTRKNISEILSKRITLYERKSYSDIKSKINEQYQFLMNPGTIRKSLHPCPKCKSFDVDVWIFQSRSADEGETEITKCNSCGYQKTTNG